MEENLSPKLKAAKVAFDTIVNANIGLILHQIGKSSECKAALAKRMIRHIELVSAGYEGLRIGMMKFDRTKGYKVSTPVCWWIMAGMQLAIRQNKKMYAQDDPSRVNARLARAQSLIATVLGKTEPSSLEIAAAIRLEEEIRQPHKVQGEKKNRGRRQKIANEEADASFRKILYAEAKEEARAAILAHRKVQGGEAAELDHRDAEFVTAIGKLYNEKLKEALQRHIDAIENEEAVKLEAAPSERKGQAREQLGDPTIIEHYQRVTVHSLQTPVYGDNVAATKQDFLVAEDETSAGGSFDEAKIRKLMPGILMKILSPDERVIIAGRFKDDMTLKEVGDGMGLSRERIRQLQEKALGKIKTFCRQDPELWAIGKALYGGMHDDNANETQE